MLKTLHDRACSIQFQDGKLNYGTKIVKLPTIEEISIVLQGAYMNEAVSHIQRLKAIKSALGSVSVGIQALLGGVSGVVQVLVQDLLCLF